ELNPTLGKYQDESQCFPLAQTWYTVYRNYESDPIFGGPDSCLSDFETGTPVDGEYPLAFKFGNQTVETVLTLESSDGYTAKNVVKIQHVEENDFVELYVAYLNCKECVVLRNTYVSDSACSLLVPKSELGHHSRCCNFVFDLLCGAKPKYEIYDKNCNTKK
ncbi:unnamed protein product, partial [Ixodes hexagonus]